jgi:simple sugar transport system ATP-binding protein
LQGVGELKTAGLAVVFISHKLDEVFQVADRIAIFRDGRKIGDFPSGELDQKKLALFMTAREVEDPRYARAEADDAPLMEVRGLTKAGNFEDIHFTVRRGDIFGLTGLLGSGRTELALSLFGLNPPDRGEIVFEGRRVTIHSPSAAKQIGIALLPEDRSTQGMFRDRCVRENLSSAMVEEISTRMGVLDRAREAALAENSVKRLRVRTPSVETPIGSLSGGNQQKAIVAKWVNRSPKLFIMDTPTVGVDIGSKAEIYELIQGFARDGMAILMITDEMEELLANCNRVMIMAAHRQIAVLDEEALARPDAAAVIQRLISDTAAERRQAK